MTHTLLLLANASAFGFVAFYLWQAKALSRFMVVVFVCTFFYALAIEAAEVATNHPYYYKDLLLMIGASPNWVPLSVCLFWACYVFSCMRLTEKLGLAWYERAPVDGLIAVSVDFIGDPAVSASRTVSYLGQWCNDMDTPDVGGLGAWVWCVPEDSATWLNVPLENYFAWMLVVGIFSFAARYIQQKLPVADWGLMSQVAVVLAAGVASGIIVLLGVDAFSYLGNSRPWAQWLMLGAALAFPTFLLVRARHRLNYYNAFDWKVIALPVASVVMCIGIFVWAKVDHARWPVAVVQISLAGLVSLALICLPFLGRIIAPRSNAPSQSGSK